MRSRAACAMVFPSSPHHMHLFARLPLTLLLAAAAALGTPPQTAWHSVSSKSMTLVDALSANPDYSSLLLLLQRTRLIPTLNTLNGSTLFAPTNDAISKHSLINPLWNVALQDSSSVLPDNIQEQLRQQLFYHLLNESLSELPDNDKVSIYKTLLYPRKYLDPPSQDPPPGSPWMPIPNGTLGHDSQRLRLVAREQQSTKVGVDYFGKGGVNVVKDLQDAGNGMLFGIGQVLEPPPDLATLISQHSNISYFHRIMTTQLLQYLNTTAETTLFIPTDEAWDELNPIERLYLESEFASDDVKKILEMHSVIEDRVTWSGSFKSGLELTTAGGSTLTFQVTPESTSINKADVVHPDILASNGVLHLVSSLLLPPNTLKLTTEKYLLALNCTKFVSLLHSAGLTNLINDTETQYTILAPRDDIFSFFKSPGFPEPGSEDLRKLLRYHFISGKWTPSNLKNGGLLRTELVEPGLNDGRQVIAVEVQSNKDKKKSEDDRLISFGGASVIGKPIEIGNALIYFVSRPIVPPPDALQAALPSLDLSAFLAAVFSTSKADLLRTYPGTSLLIPRNQAFKRLGLLVTNHLMAPSSTDDLENVILHHALNTVEYAYSFKNGSQHSFSTLEGTDLKIDRTSNGTLYVSSSGGWAGLKGELSPKDLLTQTGVIHELSDVMIPRTVDLTIGKLVKAARGGTMGTLANKAGFEWVLNGTSPPEGSPWSDKTGNVGWTLLCPPDEAFKHLNLTQIYSDVDYLHSIVAQHLIPTAPLQKGIAESPDPLYNNRPLVFDDATYSTVQSSVSAYGDLLFQRRSDTKEYVVGIKGARGTNGQADAARVLSWGRSTTGSGTGGVVQIDRLLIPYRPSWWFEYGAPTVVGGLGVLLICAFFYGVRLLWLRDTTEATYEPVGGFGRDDDDS